MQGIVMVMFPHRQHTLQYIVDVHCGCAHAHPPHDTPTHTTHTTPLPTPTTTRVGTRINWKGHIFERIRNYTADNKATAVGHALKKHYQNFLLDYEAANPRDLCRDLCIICHERNVPMQHDFDPQQPIGGASLQAAAPNWIACDVCGRKSHFSCDVRPGLATYDEYMAAKVAAPGGGGPMYSCILCSAAEGLEVLRGCAPGYVPPVQEGGAADGADGCGADGAAPMEQE